MSRLGDLAAASLAVTTAHAKARARRAAKQAILLGVAALAGGMALVYMSIAAYISLSGALGPAGAALCVGLFFFLVAVILVLSVSLLNTKKARVETEAVRTPSPASLVKAVGRDAEKYAPYLALISLAVGFFSARK